MPDFFIVGAPKCGTTSLAAWLSGHPAVFIAHPKEPSYFDTDSPRVGVRRLDHYLRCFSAAKPEHRAIGEASPNYLFSAVAVRGILKFNRDARFIVALRDPVRMAPSLHAQLYYNHHEDLPDFTAAWAAQERRRRGIDLPAHCRLPQFLQYRAACSVGTQLARLYEVAGRERVCVVLLDDLDGQPRAEYLRILDFLGVPDDGRAIFPTLNSTALRGARRSWLMGRNLGYLKQRLGLAHLSLTDWTASAPPVVRAAGNGRSAAATSLNDELVAAFESEVTLLEQLLSRDLRSLWRRPAIGREVGVSSVS
jgi:hypothetical protein